MSASYDLTLIGGKGLIVVVIMSLFVGDTTQDSQIPIVTPLPCVTSKIE